jgi:hypothetical protein
MKLLKISALALMVAAPVHAGGLSEPMVESAVIQEQAVAPASRVGVLVPILALVLIGLALSGGSSSSDDGDGGDGGDGGGEL